MLDAATAAELARRRKSLRERERKLVRLDGIMKASPPTHQELHRLAVHISPGCTLPPGWAACLAQHEAATVHQVLRGAVFIADNPWEPGVPIAWAARLKGAWIVAPNVYIGKQSGPALKFFRP